jgi:hypothetical protein
MLKQAMNYIVSQFSSKPQEKREEDSDPATLSIINKLRDEENERQKAELERRHPFPTRFGKAIHAIRSNAPIPEGPVIFKTVSGIVYGVDDSDKNSKYFGKPYSQFASGGRMYHNPKNN